MVKKSLHIPSLERDACGIGCVVNINGVSTYEIIDDAINMLENMEHRGATGSDPATGDGAGILMQIPHQLFKSDFKELNIDLPDPGKYGVGMFFFPAEADIREECKKVFKTHADELGFDILGYRKVPVDMQIPGLAAKNTQPCIEQVFLAPKDLSMDQDALERKLFVLRNYTTHFIGHYVPGNKGRFYAVSLSSRIIIYKGQLRTDQVRQFFYDLQDSNTRSSMAMVHSRFSTNTFPNWKLAQPFRFIAHNGEINTIRGNLNKMKSKEALMKTTLFSESELKMLLPVTDGAHSDSANLDALVELLTLGGRPLAHVMMMLVPEAWQDNKFMDPSRKAFYKFHASLMEPWDGPAALFFTDGKQIGATLDRNGLRPARYCITKDNKLIMASEVGVIDTPTEKIVKKGRLEPGKMLIADLVKNKIFFDDEIKAEICENKPYYDWIKEHRIKLRLLPESDVQEESISEEELLVKQKAYGYTSEDIKLILKPMAEKGVEPIGSMGADAPLAVLSKRSQHISNYFKQFFAQVSNPPIDPIRERMVMSLFTRLGESQNILEETPDHTRQIHVSQPVLNHSDFEKLKTLEDKGFRHYAISCFFNPLKYENLEKSIDRICAEAEQAVINGKNLIILSNRNISSDKTPIPSLVTIGAVHHHLVKKNLRTKAGLIVEAGDAWETHHFATIIGYGASAVYPFIAMKSIEKMTLKGKIAGIKSTEKAISNYQKAIGYGLLKVMSKMGISTLQSYQSAQIFECIGLGKKVIDKCFKGTISRIEGLDFQDLAKEIIAPFRFAFPEQTNHESPLLDVGGFYQWKRRGEKHMLTPDVIHLLQKSTKLNDYQLYKKYTALLNEQKEIISLRSCLTYHKMRKPAPLEEVEPIESILKRFATGAMSFGSLSHEAHSTLAIAMNRIGGKSNSGEGGEDEERYKIAKNGDSQRSAVKQVASGRFGVTSNYLTNADEIQIKMAQGAKPGEGGQLPGHKVDEWIGRVRHSTPGVGLISPPPHHDIYSIEDLKQLIYDLKNANRFARINVKLVSEAGVGTIAAGVAKAKADVIMISGADGGTGASPLSSLRHTGLPWELGLAEAHQTLMMNRLRNKVTLQTDGKILTGRDIAIATLLGAEEWGVATAALIVEGCIMMRKCHLNTCPVGIATQNPHLRGLFTGNPDHIVNLFRFLAMELREIMAELGFRSVNEMVGRADFLKVDETIDHWKMKKIDLSPVLVFDNQLSQTGRFKQVGQDLDIEKVLDREMIKKSYPALKNLLPVKDNYRVSNVDRSVGTMLSNEVSKRFGSQGLPEDFIYFNLQGSAGQSFGAFLTKGISLELEGESNDYFGKGLSGGKLIVYPPKNSVFEAEKNIIIGNVAFYGGTSGEAYINGMAGERFAVRNSGVQTVVEGIGDHGCEYMTGGTVVILGDTGKNFGAGMSGGIAFIIDESRNFSSKINPEMISLEKPDDSDFLQLKELIEKHVKYTASKKANLILEDWDQMKDLFIKVIPNDYKSVLEKKKLEKTTA